MPLDPEGSKLKKAANRDGSPRVLTANGIPFTSHNGGAHLLIDLKTYVVDFWPGTGLWHVRSHSGQDKGRGVFPLVRYIRKRSPWLESPEEKLQNEMKTAEEILQSGGQSPTPTAKS